MSTDKIAVYAEIVVCWCDVLYDGMTGFSRLSTYGPQTPVELHGQENKLHGTYTSVIPNASGQYTPTSFTKWFR